MHTPTCQPVSSPRAPLTALLHSKWACLALVAGCLATVSSVSRADPLQTVLGAGLGAAAGAAIGQSVGGHNGALVGAGAGGLIGASVARGHSAPAHVAYPGYPVYPVQQPYTYARPPVVVWQPPPQPIQYWQAPRHRHHHGHHYGHRDDHREWHHAPPARDHGRGNPRHWD